jgi:hypothetical protein
MLGVYQEWMQNLTMKQGDDTVYCREALSR